jgi:hypothetical protein
MRPLRVPAIIAVIATVALGCGTTTPEPTGDGDFLVRVSNVGDVELRDVAVYVSESDSVRLAVLARGASSEYRPATETHENPLVRATVAGRELVAHPVEGFVPGWNRVLEPGRYTVTIAAVPGEGGGRLLDVRVRRD